MTAVISKTKKAIYQAFLQLLNAKATRPLLFKISLISQMWDVLPFTVTMRVRNYFWTSFAATSSIISLKRAIHFNRGLPRPPLSPFSENQDHITSLLFSKNDYFLRQLHKELEHHVYSVMADDLKEAHTNLPTSYLQHLVVSNFIETLTWWLKKGQDFTYQEVVQFYLDLSHS